MIFLFKRSLLISAVKPYLQTKMYGVDLLLFLVRPIGCGVYDNK